MNPGDEKKYALDFSSPIRHVATEMEKARVEARAVSLDEMIATYRHPVSSDLYRVKLHHDLATDAEAIRFLLASAVNHLGDRVEKVDGGYRLVKPLKGMRYPPRSGSKGAIVPVENPHERFNDPFNPMGGAFTDNIRKLTGKDPMEELRESMRAVGWLPHHPAIRDERGVVLAGHRRLAVAKELGIPVREVAMTKDGIVGELATVNIGVGDEADAQRFRIAVYSNLGGKAFTPEERARIAEYLYVERDWSMAKIAEALAVSTKTVSVDLREILPEVKKTEKRGRPRAVPTTLEPDRPSRVSAEQEATILKLADEGIAHREIGKMVGLSDIPIRRIVAEERGVRKTLRKIREAEELAIIEGSSHACPDCGTIHVRSR